jgi:hypothetical protein
MVKYVRDFAFGEADDFALLLNQLADEILSKDWAIRDAVADGFGLANFDKEYAVALERA